MHSPIIATSAAAMIALQAFSSSAAATEPAPNESAPLQVRYTMPFDGRVTLAIDGADGRRVRNLIALQERSSGPHIEAWDGCDDNGRLVGPGSYRVKGIVHRPLGVTFEGAVNVSDDPPWPASSHNQHGSGGWLSDHAPPNDVLAVGDRMFISATVAEHAHGILACDLDGRKLWGEHRFGGAPSLGYAGYLAEDAGKVYTAGSGWGDYLAITEIDPATFAARGTFIRLDFAPGDGVRGEAWTLGGLSGLAARDGKLLLAFNGSPLSWTGRSAINPSKVDVNATTLGERTLDQLLDLLRARDAVAREPWLATQSADPIQHLRLGFTEPQAIGTLIVSDAVEVSALKPDAAFPGDLSDDSQWIAFAAPPGAWRALTAPPGQARTRALRFTFRNDGGKPWRGALRGAHLLPRRFENVTTGAALSASAGTVGQGGTWEAVLEKSITPENPATLVIAWPQERTWRGLALAGAFARRIIVDTYTGPADIAPNAAPESAWRQVGEITPVPRWHPLYTDDYFDAGRDITSRGIRLRVVEPWVGENPDIAAATNGKPTRAALEGLMVLRHAGDDPVYNEIPPQRISIVDRAEGKWGRHVPVAEPSWPTFDPQGRLVLVSKKRVVRLDLESEQVEPILPDGAVADPRGLAFDSKGNIHVADGGPNVVKVFAPSDLAYREVPRVIGEPGGREVGNYNPNRMENPHGIAIDARDNVWVAERDFQPKRVSVWSPDGRLLKEFLGPTEYGGGGRVDPRDPSRIYYNGMEFAIDYPSGQWSLKRILSRPVLPWTSPYGKTRRFDPRGQAAFTLTDWSPTFGNLPDYPVYLNGRHYMVEPARHPKLLLIGELQRDRVVPLTVVGHGEQWWPLVNDPKLRPLAGDRRLEDLSFCWSDRDGDGLPQPGEVTLYGFRLGATYWPCAVNDKLEMQWWTRTLKPAGFTEVGAPIYRLDEAVERWEGRGQDGWIGDFQMKGVGATAVDGIGRVLVSADPLTAIDPDGSIAWTFPNRYVGVHESHKAPANEPGALVGTLWFVGLEAVPGIGEMFMLNGNMGEWYLFTADGLLSATLWADIRTPGVQPLEVPTVRRGMRVDGAALQGEHFGGSFQRAADGTYYLVAGKSSTSIFRLHGLETMRRLESRVTVGAEDLVAAEAWHIRQTLAKSRDIAPKRMTLSMPPRPVEPDGNLGEWDAAGFTSTANRGAFAAKVDDRNLYVAWRVEGGRSLRNAGVEPTLLFTTGDSVDLQLGVDPDAEPSRTQPVPGDQRLLVSLCEGKPIGVLYRHRVPGTPQNERVGFSSPWRTEYVDRVDQLATENIGIARTPEGYAVEAIVPLELLGFKPQSATSYRIDFGILTADSRGTGTVARTYWANQTTGLVNDVPGEIMLTPALWGEAKIDDSRH